MTNVALLDSECEAFDQHRIRVVCSGLLLLPLPTCWAHDDGTMVQRCTSSNRRRLDIRARVVVAGFFAWATIFWASLQESRNDAAALTDFLVAFRDGSVLPRATVHSKANKEYHVIFSTGCSLQQHWESYVFFYHAHKVQQPGNVTRLVSGCTTEEEMELRQFHETKIATISNRFHVFFTPDFSSGPSFTKGDYKYNNKPNSVYLWMKDILGMDQTDHPKEVEDGIVLLLDPDMVLLRPLLHDFSNQEMVYASTNVLASNASYQPDSRGTRVVEHGRPMAQQDGYLGNEWMQFNVTRITRGGKFPKFGPNHEDMYWNSGPPYLATVR